MPTLPSNPAQQETHTCITFTTKSKRKTPWTMSSESMIAKTMELVETYEWLLLKMKPRGSRATVLLNPTWSTWAQLNGVWSFVGRDGGSGFQLCDFIETVSPSWGSFYHTEKRDKYSPLPHYCNVVCTNIKTHTQCFVFLRGKAGNRWPLFLKLALRWIWCCIWLYWLNTWR